MGNPNGVYIIGETRNAQVSPITLQLISKGRDLADDLDEELSVILIGHNLNYHSTQLTKYGFEKLYIIDHPTLKYYHPEPYAKYLVDLVNVLDPNILLLGQTFFGRDIAPLMAGKLKSGLATNCVDLTIDPISRLLVHTRPVFGGNLRLDTVSDNSSLQMATLKPNSAPLATELPSREAIVSLIPVETEAIEPKVKVIDRALDPTDKDISLEEARIIVAGGLGVGGKEGFELLQEMATTLGGTVGSSLPPVNAGIVPNSYHIGQTGKIVAPELYFAIGISGQPQHLAGCEGSGTIVAINTDQDANIFNSAKFGVIGDFKDIVPAFTKRCKELQPPQ